MTTENQRSKINKSFYKTFSQLESLSRMEETSAIGGRSQGDSVRAEGVTRGDYDVSVMTSETI